MLTTTAMKRIAPPKRLIFGPGPSMIDPRAYEAMGQPLTGIRDPYFLSVMAEIQSGLREVLGTRNKKTLLSSRQRLGRHGSGGQQFCERGLQICCLRRRSFCRPHRHHGPTPDAPTWCAVIRNGAKFSPKTKRPHSLNARSPTSWPLCRQRHPPAHINRAERSRPPLINRRAGHCRLCHLHGRHARRNGFGGYRYGL